jgi:hypothetical protein
VSRVCLVSHIDSIAGAEWTVKHNGVGKWRTRCNRVVPLV